MRLVLAASIALASALTTLALASPAFAEVRTFNHSGFRKIEVEKGFKVEFTQASTYSVVIDSRYNNFDMIKVEMVGDTLRITRPQNPHPDRNIRNVEDIVRISAPDLDALKLEAGITFRSPKLTLDRLDIDAHAGIIVDIDDLRVDTLDVDMDAGSKFAVAGTCSKLKLNLGAAVTVDAKDLKCREADIDTGPASKVHAFASERAVANAGVSAAILVSGKPRDFKPSQSRVASSVKLVD
jgi:hypothetical protein